MMEHQRPLFLLEEELTYKLRGIFIEISRQFGYQLRESVYHNFCIVKFQEAKINYQSKPRIAVLYNFNKVMGYCEPDFIIEDKVIVEIKAQSQLTNSNIDQLMEYLKINKYKVGLLVNFGTPVAQIIRRVHSKTI